MCSHDEIIGAVTAFYRQILRHPYLAETVLKIPPASGWENTNTAYLQKLAKNQTVVALLKRLPYLESSNQYERLLIGYETAVIDYTQKSDSFMEEVNPLPSHCIYLTEGIDREGYSLVLNTENGSITAYSVSGYEIDPDAQQGYDSLPHDQKWKSHRTLPAAEFFDMWAKRYARLVDMLVPNTINAPTTGTFHSRATNRLEAERLAQETGPFEKWEPNVQDTTVYEDGEMRQLQAARVQHTANIYNCFLRHGWPENFDKEACKAEALELEKHMWTLEKAFMDSHNPDAALFDD